MSWGVAVHTITCPLTPRNRHSWMGTPPLKIKFKRPQNVNLPAETKNKRQEV
jgi:hypothetical protein